MLISKNLYKKQKLVTTEMDRANASTYKASLKKPSAYKLPITKKTRTKITRTDLSRMPTFFIYFYIRIINTYPPGVCYHHSCNASSGLKKAHFFPTNKIFLPSITSHFSILNPAFSKSFFSSLFVKAR